MGYELHITRKENWYDKNEQLFISEDEWKNFLSKDSEMRLDNFAETKLSNGNLLRMEKAGIAVWTANGEDMPVWFDHNSGNITVKNPDEKIIKKMLNIASTFKAKVQGDEGEVYELNAKNEVVSKTQDGRITVVFDSKKPWWKFW